jgi:gas vesicle protein
MRAILSFLGGLLAGSGIMLFFAPQSGEELREGIKNRYEEIKDHSQQAAREREAELRAELAVLTNRNEPDIR